MEHFLADDGEKIYLKISGDGPLGDVAWLDVESPGVVSVHCRAPETPYRLSLGRERPRRTSLAGERSAYRFAHGTRPPPVAEAL